MEILSDTTFRGKASFTSGFDVTGTSTVTFANTVKTTIGCLYLNNYQILVKAYGVGDKVYEFPWNGGMIVTDNSIHSYANYSKIGSFENPTIPSGCKKFAINQDTAKNLIRRMDLDFVYPYITQIRKVSNNELMDITISGPGTAISEFVFERASTDEIPESYFKTTWIQMAN